MFICMFIIYLRTKCHVHSTNDLSVIAISRRVKMIFAWLLVCPPFYFFSKLSPIYTRTHKFCPWGFESPCFCVCVCVCVNWDRIRFIIRYVCVLCMNDHYNRRHGDAAKGFSGLCVAWLTVEPPSSHLAKQLSRLTYFNSCTSWRLLLPHDEVYRLL
jgi:hypothetical protein